MQSDPVSGSPGSLCPACGAAPRRDARGESRGLRRVQATRRQDLRGEAHGIAVSAYVLVAIVKKRLNLSASLYEILQILSLTMFEKLPLDQLLAQTAAGGNYLTPDNQLLLFD